MEISSLLRSNGVGLESQAYNVFGAAVDDYVAQGMNLARENIVQSPQEVPFSGTWTSSQYASDLVRFAPKHRFMFRVKFSFSPDYAQMILDEGIKDLSMFNYMIKQIDKPTVVFDYEPVNFYNYRTKVLKSIDHQQITMTFYDDIGNNVFAFFDAYRKAYSPISRINTSIPTIASTPKSMQEQGMDFKDPSTKEWYAASIGPLKNNSINVLYKMEVYQIFGHGQFANIFTFLNPRILQFDFDDMDHEGGNGNLLTVQMEYDALSTTTKSIGGQRSIPGLSQSLPHEIRPTYTNAPGSGAGSLSPFGDRILGGIINVGSKNLGIATSQAIQKTLGPGSGYIGYSTGSIISDTSRYTLRSAQSGISQPFTAPISQPIIEIS